MYQSAYKLIKVLVCDKSFKTLTMVTSSLRYRCKQDYTEMGKPVYENHEFHSDLISGGSKLEVRDSTKKRKFKKVASAHYCLSS